MNQKSEAFQRAYYDLLIEIATWREGHEAKQVRLFAEALARGELSTTQERTTYRTKCFVCLRPQQPGMQVHQYAGNRFNVCNGCMDKITGLAKSAHE